MRYGDWDILLFPGSSKVPMKEFKVACHVVHDSEFTHNQGSFGLPTVCCFVPSLDAGAPFQISVHCWGLPSISQFTKSYTKHVEDVNFEARLLIDGRLVASTSFERESNWPHVITNSFEFSKNGDLETLRFPNFREELLQQNYWRPGDDLGRIKIVISEGFPRDSLSMPVERVKNIVAFSFQHAPLDVLEGSKIAWPNPSMWQREAYNASMAVPTYTSDANESHAHSPRQHRGLLSSCSSFMMPFSQISGMVDSPMDIDKPVSQDSGTRMEFPFTTQHRQVMGSHASMGWLADVGQSSRGETSQSGFQGRQTSLRKARMSSTDTSMPDYPRRSEQVFEPSALSAQSEEDSYLGHSKVPANTPDAANTINLGIDDAGYSLFHPNMSIPVDLANSLTTSLLNQPLPHHLQSHTAQFPAPIKSRKEARFQAEARPSPSNGSSASLPSQDQQHDLRKVSQQMYLAPGASLPTTIAAQQNQSQQRVMSRNVSETAKRTASTGAFAANLACQSTSEMALRAVSGNSSVERGGKRSRNFTPASAKVIDEEDEPRRPSPKLAMARFAEGAGLAQE